MSGRDSYNKNGGSLDKRMELLESRFTDPSVGKQPQQAASDVTAFLGSMMSSPKASSHHSFGFDAPTLTTTFGDDLSNMSSPSGLLDSNHKRKSSLMDVQLAAERQMQRVIESGNSRLSSASNQTMVTSHITSQSDVSSKGPVAHKVVAESPPLFASPPLRQHPAVPGNSSKKPAAMKPAPVTNDKRKSIPVKRPQPSVVVANSSSSSTQEKAGPRKRTRLNFPANHSDSNSRSPKQVQPTGIVADLSNTSRGERSNPSFKTTSKSSSKKTSPTSNNTDITHFFSSIKPKVAKSITNSKPGGDTLPSTGALESLQAYCQSLEQSNKEMSDQLKAVSNNQTIMHTALKAALSAREKELDELKSTTEASTNAKQQVIEDLIRDASTREAQDLRQQLASDGARLGRITYTRAGMRTVEVWEDGQDYKALQRRREELEQRKTLIETRREKVEQATREMAADNSKQVNISVGDYVLTDLLSIEEMRQSVCMHLADIRNQEQSILTAERAFNKEKADHIRALKRVQSEDASRFRGRPKLNDRYVLLSLLGKGGFSEVWRAYDLEDLSEVAVKIHQLDPRWSESKKDNYTKHVSREYEIHRDVRHARIVSLFDVFEIDNNSFATVLEYCNGTDLDSMLKEKKTIPECDAKAILLQILSGMSYLSQPSGNRQGIIHYDLKPGNILFDANRDVKITDFGLSKLVDTPDAAESMELTSQGAGTYWYLPPECFVTHQAVRISNKVDVWSIGVIFYQMLFGKRPFGDGMSQDRVLTENTMLNARDVRFPATPNVSEEAKAFVRHCLTYDQAFRPNIAQICQNAYIL